MPKHPVYYHVAPRYTPGSPAQVNQATAQRVAAQEQDGWERAKSGAYGEMTREQAENLGLSGIVYTTMEVGSNFLVEDLLTHRCYRVPKQWWGVEGADRTSTSWYDRTDTNQFAIGESGQTAYELRGKKYEATRDCRVCGGEGYLRSTGKECEYCHGRGKETYYPKLAGAR